MEKIIRTIDRISQSAGILAGFLLISGMVLVLMEIILRTFFSKTLYITGEYTGYLVSAITFLGLAYTLKDKGHIRMTFLQTIFKGKSRLYLDIYAFFIGFVFFALVTYTTGNFFWDSVVSQTRSMQISKTYLAIPQFFMPLGSLIITLQFIAELMRSVLQLKTGTVDVVNVETKALGR